MSMNALINRWTVEDWRLALLGKPMDWMERARTWTARSGEAYQAGDHIAEVYAQGQLAAMHPSASRKFDPAKQYTAWDLAGDWAWNDEGYAARIVGGRTLYETATATRTESVRLDRLALETDRPFHQITRYVAYDTPMELVFVGKAEEPA